VNPILAAKLGAAALLLIVIAGVGYHFGGLSSKTALEADHAAMAKAATDALLAQRASAQAQAINDNAAEKQHDQDLEAIPLHIRHDPVFVRVPGPAPNCPMPGTEVKAAGQDPGSGGAESGYGRDLRPSIEKFKIKYETVLADCRRLNSEWPTQ